MANRERAQWRVTVKLAKYAGDVDSYRERFGKAEGERRFLEEHLPETVDEMDGNLLVIGGVSALFQCLIGNGTGTAAQALTYFNNGNAYIGVGDSSTAEADTQTDLQASTNKARQAMDATYPLHTDSTGTAGSKTITFRSTFGSAAANFAWAEWGIFNASTAGRMLNRKVQSNGTKASGGSWQLTVTVALA